MDIEIINIEPPIVETDLTDEENAMIEKSLAEYRADTLNPVFSF